MKEYTVQSGDTLYGISKQFGMSVDDIKKLNNLTTNNLEVGQVLKMNENKGTSTYTVQKGDSLYTISNQFDIPVSELININNLTDNSLQIGQVLNLVQNDLGVEEEVIIMPIYENYTVKKGDNLYSIANQFGTTVNQIKKDNNLTSNLLSLGQILKVQVGEETIGIEECFGEGYENLGKTYLEHKVVKGDSLYSIARNYNTTVDNIMKLNDLKGTSLDIGQILKIKEIG